MSDAVECGLRWSRVVCFSQEETQVCYFADVIYESMEK